MPRLMKTKTLTVGLDLGDRRHTACVLDEAGDILAEEPLANTREVLTAFSARYPGATFVMETGTHSPWVSRLLTAQGHPVIVANARMLADMAGWRRYGDELGWLGETSVRERKEKFGRLSGVGRWARRPSARTCSRSCGRRWPSNWRMGRSVTQTRPREPGGAGSDAAHEPPGAPALLKNSVIRSARHGIAGFPSRHSPRPPVIFPLS